MNFAKYNGVAMVLHWVTALLMIFMVVFGEDLIRVSSTADAASVTSAGIFLPSLHVSIGVSILLLTVIRLAWRVINPPPAYPGTMKPWEVIISKITHLLFYVLMLGLPVSGWLAFGSYSVERPLIKVASAFGLFPMPVGPDLGQIGPAMHGLGSNAAIALVILHVLAALKHQFIDGDTVMRRMLPH